jgi:hypothetical protein
MLAFGRRLGHKAGMVERRKSMQRWLQEFQGQLRRMLPLVEGPLQAGEVQEPEALYAASQEERICRKF